MSSLLSQPSPHRRLMLRIAQRLSKQDVEEILYLSGDFIPLFEVEQISSAVHLMRSLEQHGKLVPGRYSFLLSCLHDIGRLDLAAIITQVQPLSALPVSLEIPNQLLTLKLQLMDRKHQRYVSSILTLKAECQTEYWQKRYNENLMSLKWVEVTQVSCDKTELSTLTQLIFQNALKGLRILGCTLTNDDKDIDIRTTMNQMEETRVVITKLMSKYHPSTAKIEIQNIRDKINRYKVWYKDLTEAVSALLSDLVADKSIDSEFEALYNDMAAMLEYLNMGYQLSGEVPLLINILLQSFDSSIDEDLRTVARDHLMHLKAIIIRCNNHGITELLQGTSFFEQMITDGLIDVKKCSRQYPIGMFSVSILTVVLLYSEQMTSSDILKLKERLRELIYRSPKIHIHSEQAVCEGLLHRLGAARKKVLSQYLVANRDTEELIESIFQC